MRSLRTTTCVHWALALVLAGFLSGCASAAPHAHDPGAGAAHPPGHAHDAPDDGSADDGVTPPAPPQPEPVDAQAAELAAYDRAKPVFEKHCVRCHRPGEPGASKGALEHFAMAGYPFGGHHAHEISKHIRAALGVGGKATMPKDRPGVVAGEELALVLAWADAVDGTAGTPSAPDSPEPPPQPVPAPHHH